MGDVSRSLDLISTLAAGELVENFKKWVVRPIWMAGRDEIFGLRFGEQEFTVIVHASPRSETHLAGRGCNVTVTFHDHPRSRLMNECWVAPEVDLVFRFLMNRDRVVAGHYHHEFFPYMRWDWGRDGVWFNTDPKHWDTPMSRVLRRRLREEGVSFSAGLWESVARYPLVSSVLGVRYVDGWSQGVTVWPRGRGVFGFVARVWGLAEGLGVSSGVWREATEFRLEFEAFDSLVERALGADLSGLGLELRGGGWPRVLVEMVAVSLVAERLMVERGLLDVLAVSEFEGLVGEATVLARELNPGAWE